MPTRRWLCWTIRAPPRRALLGAFRYSKNPAILHSDASLMPKRRAVWSSWNYIGPPSPDEGGERLHRDLLDEPAAKYCRADTPLFVTLNPQRDARPRHRRRPRRSTSIRCSTPPRCARSGSSGRCKASATPGSAAPISAPAFTRTACKRAWPWPKRSAACGVPGRSPTSPAASSLGRRRRCTAGAGRSMTANSALYVGAVIHRRLRPRRHYLRHAAFWMLLDLDEIDALHRRLRLFSRGRFNAVSFYDTDHGEQTREPLRAQVERHLAAAGISLGRRRRPAPVHAAHFRLRLQSAEHLFLPPSRRRARRAALRSSQHLRRAAQLSDPGSTGRRRHYPAKLRQVLLRVAIHGHELALRFSRRSAERNGLGRRFRGRRGGTGDRRLARRPARAADRCDAAAASAAHAVPDPESHRRDPLARAENVVERICAASRVRRSRRGRSPRSWRRTSDDELCRAPRSPVRTFGPFPRGAVARCCAATLLHLLQRIRGRHVDRYACRPAPRSSTAAPAPVRRRAPGAPLARAVAVVDRRRSRACPRLYGRRLPQSRTSALLEFGARNARRAKRHSVAISRLRAASAAFGTRSAPTPERGSRRNIAAHYDLGNAFYARWLDRGMNYSSALFTASRPNAGTGARTPNCPASSRFSTPRPEHRVLEIGCGWGPLAERLAVDTGCRRHRHHLVRRAACFCAGAASPPNTAVNNRDLRLQDYRDVEGRFDRIVSIEMLEAVGERYLAGLLRQATAIADRYRHRRAASHHDRGTRVSPPIGVGRISFSAIFSPAACCRRSISSGGSRARRLAPGDATIVRRELCEDFGRMAPRFLHAWPDIEPLGFDALSSACGNIICPIAKSDFRSAPSMSA